MVHSFRWDVSIIAYVFDGGRCVDYCLLFDGGKRDVLITAHIINGGMRERVSWGPQACSHPQVLIARLDGPTMQPLAAPWCVHEAVKTTASPWRVSSFLLIIAFIFDGWQ